MKRGLVVATLLCVAAALGGEAMAADLVVISSSLEELTSGTIVDGRETLSVPAGASVTLVSKSGKILRLKGPYRGRPDASRKESDSAFLETLSRVVSSEDDKTSSLAAFRRLPSEGSNVWTIHVQRGGTYCVRADRPVRLMRTSPGEYVSLVIERVDDDSPSVAIPVAAGRRTVDWPGAIPLVDGASYLVRLREDDPGERFRLVLVPAKLPTDLHRAVWMADHGCMRQARRLVDEVARGSD